MQFFLHSSSARDTWQVCRSYDNITFCVPFLLYLFCIMEANRKNLFTSISMSINHKSERVWFAALT